MSESTTSEHRQKRDQYRARLRSLLAIAPPAKLLQLFWGVEALRAGREADAARVVRFTTEQADQEITAPWSVRAWELETLVNLSFQYAWTPGPRILDCSRFDTAAHLAQVLRDLENAEYGMRSRNVLLEMHRIGQRQFSWQRGLSLQDFYRPVRIFGQGQCATYFEDTHGLPITQFAALGFALFAWLSSSPAAKMPFDYKAIGLSHHEYTAGLRLLVVDQSDVTRDYAKMLAGSPAVGWPTAYRPSLLRQRPIISFEEGAHLVAPIPALIVQRITHGLYYDVVGGAAHLRNEIANRFECYVLDFIRSTAPLLFVEPEYIYAPQRGREVRSPDLLISDGGDLRVVIECKSTKLTLAAQYSESPAQDAASKYDEIAHGVFQLWRYFSHCRRGISGRGATATTRAVLLTMDSWVFGNGPILNYILDQAGKSADADGEILEEDRRQVVFTSIADFEMLLGHSNEAAILETLDAASLPQYRGWFLQNLRQQVVAASPLKKPFPFNPIEVLPWWGNFGGGAPAKKSGPSESFSADLDDEIPF